MTLPPADDIATAARYAELADRLRRPHPLAYVLTAGLVLLCLLALPWFSVLLTVGANTAGE